MDTEEASEDTMTFQYIWLPILQSALMSTTAVVTTTVLVGLIVMLLAKKLAYMARTFFLQSLF